MAGMTFLRPMLAVLRTPQRSLPDASLDMGIMIHPGTGGEINAGLSRRVRRGVVMMLLTVERSKHGEGWAFEPGLNLSGVTPGERVGLAFHRV
jgi:hypothetical protein